LPPGELQRRRSVIQRFKIAVYSHDSLADDDVAALVGLVGVALNPDYFGGYGAAVLQAGAGYRRQRPYGVIGGYEVARVEQADKPG
jgi:hypothetical protein